jgi:hypothetical protein
MHGQPHIRYARKIHKSTAEGSISVHLTTVFVQFLREPVKSTIIVLYEQRISTFTKSTTVLPIYLHVYSLKTQLILLLKRKIKKVLSSWVERTAPLVNTS